MTVDSQEGASWCIHERKLCAANCELGFAEQKLRAAHRAWHHALDSYHEPEDFRMSLNSLIQELRNVTFALQARKSSLEGFEEWYSSIQEELKADPFMKWVSNARTRVIKQSDLEAHSVTRATVETSYYDHLDKIVEELTTWKKVSNGEIVPRAGTAFEPPVNISAKDILRAVRKLALPMRVRQDASLTIERRWIVTEFSDHEILSLLSYAFAKLREILFSAHKELLGPVCLTLEISEDSVVEREKSTTIDALPRSGQMACMIYTREQRISVYRLTDGSEVEGYTTLKVERSLSASRKEVEDRYGPPAVIEGLQVGSLQKPPEIRSFMRAMTKLGRQVLASGDEHAWLTHLYKGGRPVSIRAHAAADVQEKRVVINAILSEALQSQADAVLMISEAWQSEFVPTVDGSLMPPALHPNRLELLGFNFLAKSGYTSSWTIPFRTVSGEPPNREVVIGEAEEEYGSQFNLFLPLMKAWGIRKPYSPGDSFFKPS